MVLSTFTLGETGTPHRFSWTPAPVLLTPVGNLQGGAGLGAAVAAMERSTGRPLVWATAQYLGYAPGTDPVDLDVTIEVAGHNTTQARCVLSRDGAEILTAHGALGRRREEAQGVWCRPPEVAPPDGCDTFGFVDRSRDDLGAIVEFRLARGRQLRELGEGAAPGDGSFAMWVRAWEGDHDISVADLAFLGDFMPMAFADALGAPFFGNSLDNTLRVGRLTSTGWVLLSAHAQQVANGFGFGHAEMWAEDGTLLGAVSQTVVLRRHARPPSATSDG